MTDINERPRSCVFNLIDAFPGTYAIKTMGKKCRSIPIGIEIEVPWRAYFPDLWVDGFPFDIDQTTFDKITEECTKREKVLLPKLELAEQCGVPSGADKYWEFAFDPVTDVNIIRNQVHILKKNQLIPVGRHALHITVGGIWPCRDLYFVALILEAYACSEARIRSGVSPIQGISKGWARKGRAGIFGKMGTHDIQHGYDYGTEFRLLYTPDNLDSLMFLLDRCQVLCDVATNANHPERTEWEELVADMNEILLSCGLPDCNYGRPHEDPHTWNKFANHFYDISFRVRCLFQHSSLVDYDPQIV